MRIDNILGPYGVDKDYARGVVQNRETFEFANYYTDTMADLVIQFVSQDYVIRRLGRYVRKVSDLL
jgi:hypothetical protein